MAGSIQGETYSQWLTFGEAHDLAWKTNFASIGITEAQGTAYMALVTAARTAYDEMIVARNAAKDATQDFYVAAQDMYDDAAMLLGIIKGYANTQANPQAVYSAASIPPPADPTPAGPPVDCTDLKASLTNIGNVELSWKGSLAKNQFFSVWRKLTGETSWTLLGSVRSKSFLDTTVPEAVAGGQYQVKAQRGIQISEGCEPVGIIFGTVQLAA
jgi:hypothetical protein